MRGLLNFFTTSISRQAVGKTMTIMVDANHAYDTMAPTRVGRQIEELDIAWFEEQSIAEAALRAYAENRLPVSGDDVSGRHIGN